MKVVLAIPTALLALGTASGVRSGKMESTTARYSSDSETVYFYGYSYYGCTYESISVYAATDLIRNDGKKEPINFGSIDLYKYNTCTHARSWRSGSLASGLVLSGNARQGAELMAEGTLSGKDCSYYDWDCNWVGPEPFKLHAILTSTGVISTGHTNNNDFNPITGYQLHSQYKSAYSLAEYDLSGSELPLLSLYEFDNNYASINDVKSGSITIIKPSETEQGTRKALRSL
jgi:hypothetical protein